MTEDSTFTRLLSELGQILGIAPLAPSLGVCQLVFDGRHVVHLMHAGARDLVLLSCSLDGQGMDGSHALRMARADFLQAGNGGVILCVAPDGRPCMQLALALRDCSASDLETALESLLNQAERWADSAPADTAGPGRRPDDPALFLQSV